MRYIGNKSKILGFIDGMLSQKGLLRQGLTFFDAFTGTASVARHYKGIYNILAEDNLFCSYVIAQARLNTSEVTFATLGFDPFEYFNARYEGCGEGFVARNFAPGDSERMYFSHDNACFIDFIRTTTEEWFNAGRINIYEKYFLIASLLESLSKVANVAGVYGAYLKTWDPRAVKKMTFFPIEELPAEGRAQVFNEDIFDVLGRVSGDIIYIDPPYTKNQYSVQYHLLETIAKYDDPVLSGKTGARDMSAQSSVFSKTWAAHDAFQKLIAESNFRHILVSYSSDGIMSKEYIESVLKRYGKPETYEFKKFSYKQYKNSKSAERQSHFEYLFYIEKREHPVYQSPLNFIGGKYDMVDFFKEHMPADISTFYDLFAGGFNVGINIDCEKIVYNDVNFKVRELLEYITAADMVSFCKYTEGAIKKFGLTKGGKESYLMLREKYNNTDISRRDCRDLFLLIMYGFQQQIRFNGSYNYNNPVGQAGFNDKVLEKLISFSYIAKRKNIVYRSQDYQTFADEIGGRDFVYIDPPYLITLGSYNDGKRGFNGWNEAEERRLHGFLDMLNARGVRFMLSNVLEHNGKKNVLLSDWVEAGGYTVIPYGGKARKNRNEVIIINY